MDLEGVEQISLNVYSEQPLIMIFIDVNEIINMHYRVYTHVFICNSNFLSNQDFN